MPFIYLVTGVGKGLMKVGASSNILQDSNYVYFTKPYLKTSLNPDKVGFLLTLVDSGSQQPVPSEIRPVRFLHKLRFEQYTII